MYEGRARPICRLRGSGIYLDSYGTTLQALALALSFPLLVLSDDLNCRTVIGEAHLGRNASSDSLCIQLRFRLGSVVHMYLAGLPRPS